MYLVIADKSTGHELNVTEYGLCFIEDLLSEVTGDVIQVFQSFYLPEFYDDVRV